MAYPSEAQRVSLSVACSKLLPDGTLQIRHESLDQRDSMHAVFPRRAAPLKSEVPKAVPKIWIVLDPWEGAFVA